MVKNNDASSKGQNTAILGAAFVGSLSFAFTDSFWFNAVETEVYAMATLILAVMFYLGLRWQNEMFTPRGNKWLILISFVVGLSFGVHFMGLLTIPAISLIYFFKNYKTVTIKNFILANLAGIAILLFVFKLLAPNILRYFSVLEIFFVNSVGLPFNSGSVIAFILLVGFVFWGLNYTRKKRFIHLNTGLLCITFIVIGFSSWLMLPIRANANVTVNENNPSSARELLAYYNLEQYPKTHLFYGPQIKYTPTLKHIIMSYNLLKGKRGIIFGALDPNSIAWITAERVHEEGGTFVLSNAPIAMRMGQIDELAKKTGSQVIAADATSEEDLENLVKQSMEILGGKLDFVLHSIGMSINVRKGRAYTDQKYDWTQKGTDVSAMSFHKVMQTLYKNDAMNEWGSIVALTYMAAQRVFPDYNDMADNKAYLESIARSFGYFFGRDKNVRVNTISQSPTPTTAGKGVKGFDGFIAYADKMSPLGNATALDCANYTVSLFSDLTKRVTLQNLFNDGGFSNMGVSDAVMDTFTEDDA